MQIKLQRASLAGPSDRGQQCQTGHPKENLRQRAHSPTMIIGHLQAPCSHKASHALTTSAYIGSLPEPADYQCT